MIYLKFSLAAILMLISGCFFDSTPSPPPMDDELISIFNENKEFFLQLQENIIKDGYSDFWIETKRTVPSNIPPDIKKKYFELMRKVNVIRIGRSETGIIEFTVYSYGNVSGGRSKGYVYYERDSKPYWPRKAKESLDQITFDVEFGYKRKIEDQWFLYLDNSL